MVTVPAVPCRSILHDDSIFSLRVTLPRRIAAQREQFSMQASCILPLELAAPWVRGDIDAPPPRMPTR